MLRLALALALSALAGCAAAALPPSRSELGTVLATRGAEPTVGVRIATGVHTASATTSATVPVDVGVGYLYESSEDRRAPVAVARIDGERPPEPDSTRASHGVYLEASRTVHRRDHDRLWLGLRTELLLPEDRLRDDGSTTVLARAGWELFAGGSGAGGFTDSCGGGAGMAHGAVGVGAYLESGVRRYFDGDAAFVATGGITLRLPFLAGIAVDTCWH